MSLIQHGHGVNPGHGHTKYVQVKDKGESTSIVFPSLIAPAGDRVVGALRTIEPIRVGEHSWWVGDDALFAPNPRSDLSQSRLDDPVFIPALVRKAWQCLGTPTAPRGYYVSGLPAAWAADMEQCKRLAHRLRHAGVHPDDRIRIIAEPLGLIYSLLLDHHGERTDDLIHYGRIGVVDFGHNTLDIIVVQGEIPLAATMETYALGTAGPLAKIRARINATYDLALSLYETDLAVRRGHVTVSGRERPLPAGWETPIAATGDDAANQLAEVWKSGANLDLIVVGGGGAALEPLVAATLARFPQAERVPDGQMAIARGYAHLARRLARGL